MSSENEAMLNQYLVFSVDESYAIELSKVKEIIEYKPITAVPEAPPYIAGVMNQGGVILPVIDMRKRFEKPKIDDLQRRCVIVIHFEGAHLGLLVDNVTDIAKINPENISPPPQLGTNYAHVFIKAIGVHNEKMILIIDTDCLIHHNDLEVCEDTGKI